MNHQGRYRYIFFGGRKERIIEGMQHYTIEMTRDKYGEYSYCQGVSR